MFWRLFFTFLGFLALALLLVGLVVHQRDPEAFWGELSHVVLASILVLLSAIPVAYYLSNRLTRPLVELTFAAQQLAEGDFSYLSAASGSREVSALAQAFNRMSARLAALFTQVEQDRRQLRTILSGMVEGVLAFDNDQRILFANDRAAKMLEVPTDSLVGKKLWDVTRQRAILEMALATLMDDQAHQEELDWQGPAQKSLAIYMARLPGPKTGGAIMVLNDISHLRKLERLRQDFMTNVSHELKTPLANIKSSVEVLIDGAVEDESIRGNFLAEIDEQANRLHALVNDLLSIARLESGAELMDFEPISVDDAVQNCLDRHRTRAEAKGMVLSAVGLGVGATDAMLWADHEGISQILDNLVDNAIKYTPEKGRVTVRWVTAEHHVTLEVEDTGIGIPEKDLGHIFERFYRVDKDRSRMMGGTGLGLSIVKHLAQAMHGSVSVRSTLGQGTTFQVILPRAGTQLKHGAE
jgi:two-component system, OmpR family, phosphate regulon sensor histidine kinase PhoR